MIEIQLGKCLLFDLLKKRGWTQIALSDKTGIKKSQISAYIHNKQFMSLKTAILIASVLDCHVDDLYEYQIVEDQ
ncbi:hypothetical protein BAOM_3015 [Peribacillus asahii]|uniref:HTH cro/C1-type domain-containing protein n=1 Tax=Peribacillus asahii TaxID=228899 RepID=A0A3Q9RNJ1_9BACI|nr:helix-turn-helix transcriptional regulator [Peribacillus asahii]AZV43624.1 hypothetical protein BAOM_3015 [Peribacillus asahii]